jgi:hypothetical protein
MNTADLDQFLAELPEEIRAELREWIESARAGELKNVTAGLTRSVGELRKTFDAAIAAVRKEIER